ncbi:hypothetical protein FOL47_008538 [Perkinsus chesapeaki]|uniref:Structural maintenance of chromosomes protein n=1 Tax=Perkinsus chesapeaki TaxID=330153 RepID=A0A7J6LDE9_PERCH|nr:hypothetical protein FOL47_008538 [Perkinsus chesapeaki]
MHLKKLSLKGYKTYRDQTTIVDLHAGVNVFVGLNGSGKSNIYSAIRFVLGGDRIVSEQQRRSLLYQSHGKQVSSAYVELTLDNTDARIPVDKHEVTVRRTITLKTDVYHWDGKQATKAEVESWLEAAGISTKSRTYYMVEQGKVSSLALISDAKRLDLLKEVSGTRVYDLRRAESLAVMEKTKKKREQTSDIMEEMRSKLEQLETDRAELNEFKGAVREKTALEIVIADREKQHCVKEAQRLTIEAKVVLEELKHDRAVLADLLMEVDKEKNTHEGLHRETADFAARVSKLATERNTLAVEHAELSAGTELRNHSEIECANDMKRLQAELETSKEEAECLSLSIDRNKGILEDEEEKLHQLQTDVDALNKARERLAARKRNSNQSTEGSGEDVQNILERKQRRLEELGGLLNRNKDRTAKDQEHYADLVNRIEEKEREIDRLVDTRSRLQKEVKDTSSEILAVSEAIREHIRAASTMRETGEDTRQKERSLVDDFWRAAPPGVRGGYDAIMQADIEGVHGMLVEHITVPEEYRLVAEVTAGPQLFSILVENEAVADTCIEWLNSKREDGRRHLKATFCPLENLSASTTSPPLRENGLVFLTDVIEAPVWAKCAAEKVWKRYALAAKAGDEQRLTKRGLSVVTAAGDVFTRRGALKGGFIDPKCYTRISSWAKLSSLREEMKTLEEEYEKVSQEIQQKESFKDELEQNLSLFGNELQQNLRSETVSNRELSELVEARQGLTHSIDVTKRLARQYDIERNSLKLDITVLEATAAAARVPDVGDAGGVTEAEAAELHRLDQDLSEKKKTLAERMKAMAELREVIEGLRSRHALVYRKRVLTLQNEIRERTSERIRREESSMKDEQRIRWLAGELADIEQELLLAEERMTELREAESSQSSYLEDLANETAELESSVAANQAALDEKMHKVKYYGERQSLANSELDEIIARQPEVEDIDGVIRSITDDTSVLQKRLAQCTIDISKLNRVNNKAEEQYQQLNGQYEELLHKQQEMDEGQVRNTDSSDGPIDPHQAAIDDLIRSLDAEKKDNIIKSFAQINENFSNAFNELVPSGNARMKLLRRNPCRKPTEGDESDSTVSSSTGEEEYVGVALEVTFSAAKGRMRRMPELSGGQKTVVAVALLLAMQRVEQPPFYIFDEIDAALDPQYREAVARLVCSVANPESGNPAQVICTTFHSELCRVANRRYRVFMNDHASNVTVTEDTSDELV